MAQMADMGFYQAGFSIPIVTPHMGHDLIRATYVAGIDSQQMQ